MPTEILRALWGNWLFRLSLSSNELFHSNFLQTLFSDPDADEADVTDWARLQQCAQCLGLDPDWLRWVEQEYGDYPVHVYREWKQLDLAFVVRVPKKRGSGSPGEVVLFAVELKIKAYPTLQQLERYIQEMNEHNKRNGHGNCVPQLVLLSLAGAPPTATKLPQLVFAEFGALAKSLGKLSSNDEGLRAALAAYVHLCEQLHQLNTHWRNMLTEPLTLNAILQHGASYRRLGAIWFKLCAARLCALVAEKMEREHIGEHIKLELMPGLSNTNWSADFLWVRSELPNQAESAKNSPTRPIVKVGVQVEGETIRFMMNASDIRPRTGCARKAVEKVLIAQADEQGLFGRLQQVYVQSRGTATHAGSPEDIAFWQRRSVLLESSGWPRLSKPRSAEFELTGYENNATFGHADYRLKLAKTATLEDISTQIVAALRGDFNANGANSFKQVLLQAEAIFNPNQP